MRLKAALVAKGKSQLRVAFAIWNSRIAPVFDTAGEVLIVDTGNGRVTDEFSARISAESVLEKSDQLKAAGVETLVCGAISQVAQVQVEAQGIKIISFVSGDTREVIQAWLNNEIDRDTYAMPGCCRRRRGGWCDRNFKKNTGGGGRRGHFGSKCRGV